MSLLAKPIGGVLFFLVVFIVGLGVFTHGLSLYFEGRMTRAWETTSGTLEECGLDFYDGGDSKRWRVKVKYKYQVDGMTFLGDEIAVGYSGSSGRGRERAIFDRVRKARRILVWYDPQDPANSVLVNGESWGPIGGILIGVFEIMMTVAGVLFWCCDRNEAHRIVEGIIVFE